MLPILTLQSYYQKACINIGVNIELLWYFLNTESMPASALLRKFSKCEHVRSELTDLLLKNWCSYTVFFHIKNTGWIPILSMGIFGGQQMGLWGGVLHKLQVLGKCRICRSPATCGPVVLTGAAFPPKYRNQTIPMILNAKSNCKWDYSHA